VSADVASRVRIGTISLADLAKKLGITGPTLEVVALSPTGGRVANLPAGGVTYAKCGQYSCTCVGSKTGKDCTDLSKSGLCKSAASAEEPSGLYCGQLSDGKAGCACQKAAS
jgi:hypothetical protein